ncbi:Hypothetical protein SMAX5B_020481 [Scophthalmus maximus]|uniref:Uncharacterized protein n=1 Tax=Scophthalmus maximus TaxID=52904 RepID=A0A2U9C3E1_SCOMX|nr:Hypothetical protein SMAX5B_020481 [Scophthalmus maximus]
MEMRQASETDRRIIGSSPLWRASVLLTEVAFSKSLHCAPGSCSAAEPDPFDLPVEDSRGCSFSCREDQRNVKAETPSRFHMAASPRSVRFQKYVLRNGM